MTDLLGLCRLLQFIQSRLKCCAHPVSFHVDPQFLIISPGCVQKLNKISALTVGKA